MVSVTLMSFHCNTLVLGGQDWAGLFSLAFVQVFLRFIVLREGGQVSGVYLVFGDATRYKEKRHPWNTSNWGSKNFICCNYFDTKNILYSILNTKLANWFTKESNTQMWKCY